MDSIDKLVGLVEDRCSSVVFIDLEKKFDWRLTHRCFMTFNPFLRELLPGDWWTL